jgi:Asp-tRNA(Asn)/Glu-tRNA(Gln) amidotransferase A subunit family amidase
MMAAAARAPASSAAAAALARARAADPQLHAFVTLFEAPRGAGLGPLAGLPYAVKDLVDLAGRAPTLGLAAAPGPVPERDAAVVTWLSGQGARLIGCTAMTELAYEPSGASASRPRPVNPWSAGHICGGSSSGSAVAVAAGLVPLALGSDTAGSLRIPAHCCGVTAWKPSADLVPTGGSMALAPSLDVLGFLARDAALLRAVASVSAAVPAPPLRRIAVDRELVESCDGAIAACLAQLMDVLTAAGITLVPTALQPLIAACDAPVLTVLQAEAAAAHAERLAGGGLDPVLATRLGKGAALQPQLAAAKAELAQLAGTAWSTALAGADAVLLPVMRAPTPRVAQCDPASPEFSPRALYELSALTRWVNGLGLPALALPCGLDGDGLPVAAQLVGRRGSDLALLDLATELQERSTWHAARPPVFSGDAS